MLVGVQQSQTYSILEIGNTTVLEMKMDKMIATISRDLTHYLETICRIYSHTVYWLEARGTYSWGFRQPSLRQKSFTVIANNNV